MSNILLIGKVWKAIIRANNYYADLYLEIEGEGGGRVKYFNEPYVPHIAYEGGDWSTSALQLWVSSLIKE